MKSIITVTGKLRPLMIASMTGSEQIRVPSWISSQAVFCLTRFNFVFGPNILSSPWVRLPEPFAWWSEPHNAWGIYIPTNNGTAPDTKAGSGFSLGLRHGRLATASPIPANSSIKHHLTGREWIFKETQAVKQFRIQRVKWCLSWMVSRQPVFAYFSKCLWSLIPGYGPPSIHLAFSSD